MQSTQFCQHRGICYIFLEIKYSSQLHPALINKCMCLQLVPKEGCTRSHGSNHTFWWPRSCFYQTRSAWSDPWNKVQLTITFLSTILPPPLQTFVSCGMTFPSHVASVHNCRGKTVDRRAFPSWSLGIILCMHPVNERWCYNVTSLFGWGHTQNDPPRDPWSTNRADVWYKQVQDTSRTFSALVYKHLSAYLSAFIRNQDKCSTSTILA